MNKVEEGFGGALDLSGANIKGFEAIDSGTYDCELFSYEWAATKGGENAKLPAGSPRLNIQLKVIEPEFENRRFFDGFNFPPADYDEEKRATALGFFVRFLIAMGVEEDKAKGKKLDAHALLADLQGQPVKVTVGQTVQSQGANEGQLVNVVKGYKPIGDGSDDGPGGKLL